MVAAGAALSAFTDPEEVRFDSGTGDRSSAPERTPATRATAGNPTPRRSLAAIVVHPSLSVASQGVRLAEALVRGPVPSRLWSCFGAAGGHEDALAHWRLHFQSIGRRPQCIEKALAQVNKTPGRRLQNIFDRRNLGTDLKIRPACGIVEPDGSTRTMRPAPGVGPGAPTVFSRTYIRSRESKAIPTTVENPSAHSLICPLGVTFQTFDTFAPIGNVSRLPMKKLPCKATSSARHSMRCRAPAENRGTKRLARRHPGASTGVALDIGKSVLFPVIRDLFDPRPSVKPRP